MIGVIYMRLDDLGLVDRRTEYNNWVMYDYGFLGDGGSRVH